MPRFTRKKKRSNPPPRRQQISSKAPSNRSAKRLQWTRAQMDAALKSVLSGSAVSINRAAREHGIPPTTLKDRSVVENLGGGGQTFDRPNNNQIRGTLICFNFRCKNILFMFALQKNKQTISTCTGTACFT